MYLLRETKITGKSLDAVTSPKKTVVKSSFSVVKKGVKKIK